MMSIHYFKHLRKMRGGGEKLNPGINQTIDFIIKCDNKILVSKNPDVTGNISEESLIGTFSSASLINKDINRLAVDINAGILKANDVINEGKTLNEAKKNLVNLTNHDNIDVVIGLLIKKLLQSDKKSKEANNESKKEINTKYEKLITLLNQIKITPVNDDFHDLIGDVRLTQGECVKPINKCIVLTQLFKLDITSEIYNLLPKGIFTLKPFLKDSWFIGHKNLLNKFL